MCGSFQSLPATVLCKEMIVLGVQFNNELDIFICRKKTYRNVNFYHQSVFTAGNFPGSFPCSTMLVAHLSTRNLPCGP